MKFKLINHTTEEKLYFNSTEDFIDWFNENDEHCDIKEVEE